MNKECLSISWDAPIKPSKSMVGLPIGLELEKLRTLLAKYLVHDSKVLYLFDNAPLLQLVSDGVDANGNGAYLFVLVDKNLTNIKHEAQLSDLYYSRALNILIRGDKVFAITVWAFEQLENGMQSQYSYQGKTKEGIGLYRPVADFLTYSKLEFDSGEEWFYTDHAYGGLEITGYGQSLEDFPDQIITAITVIPESAYLE